ncbi:MAG: IscA/HesB family protein [Desulfovibrio sp.]|jgi:Fe-S cluster assembly iron-binding protein IscA|nr:IscA/HesB family protein [Desulfovibrio sp.]
MIVVTDAACKELDAYFDDKEKSPIRVCLAPGGCNGPSLSLALDSPSDSDDVFVAQEYVFCVNKELLRVLKKITLDFSDRGFSIESEEGFAGGCASCRSGCAGDV